MIRGRVELAGQLMAEREAEPVFPGLRQHDCRRGGCERLELVEVQGSGPVARAPAIPHGSLLPARCWLAIWSDQWAQEFEQILCRRVVG